jgi:hypothetical protein
MWAAWSTFPMTRLPQHEETAASVRMWSERRDVVLAERKVFIS